MSNMDLEKLQKKYQNVSRAELENMRDIGYELASFEETVKDLNEEREIEKIQGREHLEAGPLVQVLSIRILLDKVDENKPLVIYGRIYVEFRHVVFGNIIIHDLFNRGCDDPEILGSSGLLTLTGPDVTCFVDNLCIPLYETKIVVDVWDATQHVVFAQNSFFVEDATDGDYEQVYLEIVRGASGSLNVLYVAMPFAVLFRLEVLFFKRKSDQDEGNIRQVLNVYGKIVARYDNTCGNYADEECTLFEKQSQEFEQVVINHQKFYNLLQLSRCWMSLPAYSTLIIDLDLFDFDTKKNIFKGVIEWLPRYSHASDKTFAADDVVMGLSVSWFSSRPEWSRVLVSDMQLEDKCCDSESSSSKSNPWTLHRHENVPLRSPKIEVFSIFIGQQKMIEGLRIFGTVEVSSGDYLFDIFRRDEKDAFELLEHCRTAPILDGSRVYVDDRSIAMKFDLKDVDNNLFIKGYVEWGERARVFWPSPYNSQLCSIIQGHNGFAAVHYSIFSSALQANLEVHYKLKNGGSFGIYGSLVTQYDNYDYSTHFKKEFYRIVVFKRIQQDMVTLGINGKIPLSRSIVVVPSKSSLIIETDLLIIDLLSGVTRQNLSCVLEIEVGTCSVSMDTEDCLIDIFVKWT